MAPSPTSTTFEIFRRWLEVFYFAAGIIVPVIAVFALHQIRVAKDQLKATKNIAKTSAKRESYRAAIEQCEAMSLKVVPLDHKLDKFIAENNITYFKEAIVEQTDTGFRVQGNLEAGEAQKISEIEPLLSDLVNSVEVFAIYFLSGIAYEEIGFHSQGQYFVEKAELVAKILALSTAGPDGCKHIWPLHKKWKNRLKHERLVIEKGRIDAQLRETNVQPTIKSIGT